jgi:uncharacterized protein YcnI
MRRKNLGCNARATKKIVVAPHMQLEKTQLQPTCNWKISVATM